MHQEMKKHILYFLVLQTAITLNSCKVNEISDTQEKFKPPVSFDIASEWADSIVNLMTLDEKISLIGGDRIFFTQEIPRLEIPSVMFADATQGVHLRSKWKEEFIYDEVLPKSTAFPCPLLLASTWNKDLANDYARAIGEECKAGGISVLLGPGMNIYRISQCGRNFEYFGEDPFLAGEMIRNYVVGLQNTGTIATLKHFVANNSDYFRRRSNSIIDERTLHEIYLPAFKAGIDAGAMAVMTSYNLLNGEWCGESEVVINDLLRGQLGFKWLVMTDWWSVYDGVKTIESGQDLEMPYRKATLNAGELLKQGLVIESDVDRMVGSILRTFYAMNAFGRELDEELHLKFEEHEEIALQTAREGIILLRNENEILPLDNPAKNVLLTGDYMNKIAMGGGAATVKGYNHIVLSKALKELYGEYLKVVEEPSDEEVRSADIVILNIGTFDSEGWDRSFDLPEELDQKIIRIADLNQNTVVVVNSGSGINMSKWNDKVAAIIYAWYPGQNGALALAEILTGKINPSGKLPISIENEFKDSPGFGYIPEGEELYIGWNDVEEKDRDIHDIVYDEGIFIGYRWYEKMNIKPLYSFGFGLSYTSFEYADLEISKSAFHAEEKIVVKFELINTGLVKGSEIAQLYIKDVVSSVERPLKELKGFEKVQLNSGEKTKISIILSRKDFSFWSPELKAWTAEPGTFEILVGPSSDNLILKTQVELL